MPGPKPIPIERRFWAKVKKDANESGCWLWQASKDGGGYGVLARTNRSLIKAHIFSWELINGSVQDGLDLDHVCRIRHCVRPDHLESVTRLVNLIRGETIIAKQVAMTHCHRGHEFTPENTYMFKTSRYCRACRKEYAREYDRKR